MAQSSPSNPKPQSPTRRATSFEPLTASAFGEIIRAERVRQGIAQDQFALLASVDRSYFGKLERGERQPSLALIFRIAKGLDLPATVLVARVEQMLAKEEKSATNNGVKASVE